MSLTYPEILEMQVSAIIGAALRCVDKGIKVLPEIMIPLTIDPKELSLLTERTREVADELIEGFDFSDDPRMAGGFVVVATQGKHDRDALRCALSTDAAYVAFIGSRRKAKKLKADLLAEGVARATERGHASMTCAVDRRNVPALRLYKGMGFAEFSGRVAFVRMIEQAGRGERGIRT